MLLEAVLKLPREDVANSLERIPLVDISNGIVLASMFRPLPTWAGDVAVPDDSKVERAIAYVQLRVPGLVDLLRAHNNSRNPETHRASS